MFFYFVIVFFFLLSFFAPSFSITATKLQTLFLKTALDCMFKCGFLGIQSEVQDSRCGLIGHVTDTKFFLIAEPDAVFSGNGVSGDKRRFSNIEKTFKFRLSTAWRLSCP